MAPHSRALLYVLFAALAACLAHVVAAIDTQTPVCYTKRQAPQKPKCCMTGTEKCYNEQVCAEKIGVLQCLDLEDVPDTTTEKKCDAKRNGKCCEQLKITRGLRVTTVNNCKGNRWKKFECNIDKKCVRKTSGGGGGGGGRRCRRHNQCGRKQRCRRHRWQRWGICVRKRALRPSARILCCALGDTAQPHGSACGDELHRLVAVVPHSLLSRYNCALICIDAAQAAPSGRVNKAASGLGLRVWRE